MVGMMPAVDRGLRNTTMISEHVRNWMSCGLLVWGAHAAWAAGTTGAVAGRVTDPDGKPLHGIMVTVLEQGSGIEVTEFTASDGRFAIDDLRPGRYRVTAHATGWRPATRELSGDAASSDLVLEPKADFHEDLSGAQIMRLLPDGDRKRELLIACTGCHQFDYKRLTQLGPLKDEAGWRAVFPKMRAYDTYDLLPPDFDEAAYAAWLAEHLTLDRVKELPPPAPVPPGVARARYTEYPVPTRPELPHDLVIGPDRRIWITAFMTDAIWALDPASGRFQTYPVTDEPGVGADVRALEFDRDGMLWTLLGRTEAMVRLDPMSGKFQTYDIGCYAHSLAIDSRGDVWFNDYFSAPERIGVIDGDTGRVTTFDIPSAGLTEAQGKPLPYGLQVDANDVLWNTTLSGNTLVRFDIATGESKLYHMPTANSGPRRPGIGPDGSVWIPEYAAGKLARFDPETESFEEFDPGLSSLGPYDVAVDQRTGEVWLSGTQNSTILRFDPGTRRFLEYPWPTRPGYVRHLAVDPETGDVWSAYSAFPEDDPKLVRLQARDRSRPRHLSAERSHSTRLIRNGDRQYR
jgi:virginiamycin B lyase